MKLWKQKLGQALVSVVCTVLTWKLTFAVEGTEASGGTVTGPLLSLVDFATLLFIASLLLLLWLPRTAAILTCLAALLCLPLSLLFLAPGPFRRVVGGLWSVPLQSNSVFSWWTVGWFLTLVASCGFVNDSGPSRNETALGLLNHRTRNRDSSDGRGFCSEDRRTKRNGCPSGIFEGGEFLFFPPALGTEGQGDRV